MILDELAEVLEARKNADGKQSYVASLHEAGLNKILEKVGEEATETVLAGKDAADGSTENREHLIKEVADLWFHSMVLLSHLNLSHSDVLAELSRRFGIGGHTEKAQRTDGS